MNKIRQSNNSDRGEINQKIEIQPENPPNIQNTMHPNNLYNDIVISRSGQAKIKNLNSCLDLNDDDFIVF